MRDLKIDAAQEGGRGKRRKEGRRERRVACVCLAIMKKSQERQQATDRTTLSSTKIRIFYFLTTLCWLYVCKGLKDEGEGRRSDEWGAIGHDWSILMLN